MSIEDLFGGSSTVPLLDQFQMKFEKNIFNKVNPQIGKPTEVYGGQSIAGRNPLLNSAVGGMPGAMGMNPNVQGALDQQLSGAGDPAGVRAMYEGALGPAQLEFQRALQQVGSNYGDTWGRSGAMPEMAGRTTAEYGMGLNQLLGQLTYQDRQAAMDRQAGAIPMATNVRDSNINALNAQYGMGTAERAIEQQALTGNANNWTAKQWYSNPALALGQGLMGIQNSAFMEQPGKVNMGIGAAAGLFSAGTAGLAGLKGLMG